MGKRSDYMRRPRDAYDTPVDALYPLLPFLPTKGEFVEPCAGSNVLRHNIETLTGMHCIAAFDVEPRHKDVAVGDARTWRASSRTLARTSNLLIIVDSPAAARDYTPTPVLAITNPPWTREWLHPIILNMCEQMPTWLLLDADWMHTKQASPYMRHCRRIVSIGRVKWIEKSRNTGKDNSCWYLFTREQSPRPIFISRMPAEQLL